jgi:monovalent cation/hydrogen antiporter
MKEIEILFGLLFVMLILVAVARRLKIAYPILLVIGGLLISFIPGLPHIEVEPEIVFIVFLPPILQAAAYFTPMRDFRQNLRSIGLMAIGLVLATASAVAVVSHYVIGLSWAEGFILGAIVAPPDAIAATAVARNVKMHHRIVTVLEGESLLNDATALVTLRVALAALVTGSFSFFNAGWSFLLAAIGGIIVGLLIGIVSAPLFRRLTSDVPVYTVLTFLAGYASYILAEEVLHVSGVLAVVALGLYFSRYNSMTPEIRLQAVPVWDIVVFIINGLAFILIGLQLNGVLESLRGNSPLTLLGYAVAVCLVVIVVRFLWVFPGAYLPRLPRKVRERDPFPRWQNVFIVSWAGMRGIVSLAAALALPLQVNGRPYENRDLLIFLTFSVILATLVLQGLSLPLLVKWLKAGDDGQEIREEHKARLKTAHAARQRLTEIANRENWVSDELATKLHQQYEVRIQHFTALYQNPDGEHEDEGVESYERLRLHLLEAENAALLKLRDEGVINDEVLRRVQRDLDFEYMQLQNS